MATKKPTSKIAVLGFSILNNEKIRSTTSIRKVSDKDAGESKSASLKNEEKIMNNKPAR